MEKQALNSQVLEFPTLFHNVALVAWQPRSEGTVTSEVIVASVGGLIQWLG